MQIHFKLIVFISKMESNIYIYFLDEGHLCIRKFTFHNLSNRYQWVKSKVLSYDS